MADGTYRLVISREIKPTHSFNKWGCKKMDSTAVEEPCQSENVGPERASLPHCRGSFRTLEARFHGSQADTKNVGHCKGQQTLLQERNRNTDENKKLKTDMACVAMAAGVGLRWCCHQDKKTKKLALQMQRALLPHAHTRHLGMLLIRVSHGKLQLEACLIAIIMIRQ